MNGRCCSCGHVTAAVLDLGSHIPADFTEPGTPVPEAYPLRLMLCGDCTLLQLDDLTPRSELYHERYGFKSGVNEAVRADLAGVVSYALAEVPHPARWLDIACNDGTLLAEVPEGTYRAGIDPVTRYSPFREGAERVTDRLVSDFFSPSHFRPGEFDVITSVSMFYDLADPGEFAAGVASVLGTHGIWVIQQNYAADMIRLNAIDNIVHEHVTYFSVTSLLPLLARCGLEINDVAYSTVNGGCFRVMASHRGRRSVNGSVSEALETERAMGLGDALTWARWGREARLELARTREWLAAAKAAGERVYLYGASTRVGTILQMLGAGPDLIPYAVDRNPAKAGKVMAAAGIPVITEEEMRADPPGYLLVSPWFFRPVFLEREKAYLAAGGRFVFPLPKFEIVTG